MFDKKEWTKNYREKANQSAKEMRDKRKAAGLCPQCGKNPSKYTGRCSECLDQLRSPKLREQRNAAIARYRDRTKQKVLDHYGRSCVCCGESEEVFLCLDHIDNNGTEHREMVGKGGSTMYQWLVVHNFPEEWKLQTFCYNCNNAKKVLGVCPHQKEYNVSTERF